MKQIGWLCLLSIVLSTVMGVVSGEFISPDKSWIALSTFSGRQETVHIIDAKTRFLLQDISLPLGLVSTQFFCYDNRSLIVLCDTVLLIVNIKTGSFIGTIFSHVSEVFFSERGLLVVIIEYGNALKIIDCLTGKIIDEIRDRSHIEGYLKQERINATHKRALEDIIEENLENRKEARIKEVLSPFSSSLDDQEGMEFEHALNRIIPFEEVCMICRHEEVFYIDRSMIQLPERIKELRRHVNHIVLRTHYPVEVLSRVWYFQEKYQKEPALFRTIGARLPLSLLQELSSSSAYMGLLRLYDAVEAERSARGFISFVEKRSRCTSEYIEELILEEESEGELAAAAPHSVHGDSSSGRSELSIVVA